MIKITLGGVKAHRATSQVYAESILKKIVVIIFCLAIFSVCCVHAQGIQITGTVTDQKEVAVPFCNVVLKTADDSTFVQGCITNDKGNFKMNVRKGAYILHLSYIGYEESVLPLTVKGEVALGRLTLKESAVKLQELTVVGKREQHQSNADTYYLKDSPKTMGRNALEVISMAAGVSVDNKGISIYGKEGVRVLINDRMIQMTGTELKAYLAGIHGEDIAMMEIDRTADASYDADASAGVIKIKLRSRQSDGYDASVGIIDKVYGQTNLGIIPSFSINAHAGKFSVYGNMTYDGTSERDLNTEESKYKGKNVGISTKTSVISKTTGDNFSGRLGTMYEINNYHKIGIDIDGKYSNSIEHVHTPSSVTNNAGTTDYKVLYISPEKKRILNTSFNYIWKVNDLGSQLKMGADYYYQKNKTGDNNTLTCVQDPNFSLKSIGDVSYHRNIYTAGIDYKWVYSNAISFDLGAKYSHTMMKDHLDYTNQNGANNAWIHDDENTDDIKYKEGITAGYVNGNYHGGNWKVSAGLRYEQTFRSVSSLYFPTKNQRHTYNNFFPMFNAVYDIDKEAGHQLTFKYHSGIARPAFKDLVPYTTQQNLYSFALGNPDLTPSYNYSAGIDLLLFKGFYFGTSFTRDKDKMEMIIEPRDADGLIMDVQTKNVKRVDSYALQTFLPAPINDNILLSVTLMEARKKRLLYSGLQDKLWQFYLEAEASIDFTPNLSFETTFTYINKEFYGNMLLHHYYTLDFSLRQSFFNKKLQVALNGTNILGRKRILYIDDNTIYRRLTMKSNDESSLFSLSIRYSFGSGNKVKASHVQGFNQEERER